MIGGNNLSWMSLSVWACSCGGEPSTDLPEPGEPEPVSIVWDGEEVEASHPTVVKEGGTLHLYFTGYEGSFTVLLHATSTNGTDFEVQSGHTILEAPEDPHESGLLRGRVYDSGSRMHLLANAWGDGYEAIVHGVSEDDQHFDYADVDVVISTEDLDPSSATDVDRFEVGSTLYEPITARVWLGSWLQSGDRGDVWYIESDNGGVSWSDPVALFGAEDVPEPWVASTIGAGAVWDVAVFESLDGGYHALYSGAPPGGDQSMGLGHGWSEDGLTNWELDRSAWLVGDQIQGASVLVDGDGYTVWYSVCDEGAEPPESCAVYRVEAEVESD